MYYYCDTILYYGLIRETKQSWVVEYMTERERGVQGVNFSSQCCFIAHCVVSSMTFGQDDKVIKELQAQTEAYLSEEEQKMEQAIR